MWWRRAVLPSLPWRWVVCFLSFFLYWARNWRALALAQVHHASACQSRAQCEREFYFNPAHDTGHGDWRALALSLDKLPSPNHCESRDFLLVFKNLSLTLPCPVLKDNFERESGYKAEHNALSHMTSDPTTAIVGKTRHAEREIFGNQQEITTLTVIWARQLVSPQPKLGPVP